MVLYGAGAITDRSQARELLALAAADHWGLSPLPQLASRKDGKPFFPGRQDLHFNLSHSGTLALCALDGGPVGVDVQVVRQFRPSLLRRVCSEEERAWLDRQEDPQAAFIRLWVLKESRVKESGRGISAITPKLLVPLPERCPMLLDGLWFGCWSGPGWAAAVCGHSPPPRDILWEAEAGLFQKAPPPPYPQAETG